jgi:hypothetical protein
MPKYIGYNFTGTANSTVVTSALNGGVTDRKYNSGIWSISGINSVYGRRRAGNWLTTTRGELPFVLTPPTTGLANLVAFWDFSHQDTEVEKLANFEPTPADGSAQSAYDLTKNGSGITTSGIGIAFNGTSGQSLSILTNTTFTNSFHKGTQPYTMVTIWNYPGAPSGAVTWFSTCHGNATVNGVQFFAEQGGPQTMANYVGRAPSGIQSFSWDDRPFSSGSGMTALSWNSGGTSFIRRDKAYIQASGSDTYSTTISSPSGNNADYPFRFGNSPTVTSQGFDNGTVLYACLMYNTNLSVAALDNLFDELATYPNYPI